MSEVPASTRALSYVSGRKYHMLGDYSLRVDGKVVQLLSQFLACMKASAEP